MRAIEVVIGWAFLAVASLAIAAGAGVLAGVLVRAFLWAAGIG